MTTPELTKWQRARLDEFDALLTDYIRCDAVGKMEHPMHDMLGALDLVTGRPSPDTAFVRHHAKIIRRDAR